MGPRVLTGLSDGPPWNSVAPFLRVLRPALSTALVPSASFARLERLASTLPPAYAFIFECWLGGDQPDVDFQLFYREHEGGALASRVPGISRTWQAIRSLFSEFAIRGSGFVDGIWLEFDLGESDLGEADPRIGFAFHDLAAVRGTAGLARYMSTLDRIYSLLGAPVIDAALKDTLQRAFAALPERGDVYGTGTGLAPSYAPLRWVVTVKPHDIPGYLKQAGWPHDAGQLIVDVPGLRSTSLAIDLGDGLGDRVGIEYYFEPEGFRPFLARMESLGLCRAKWIEPYLASRESFRGPEPGWPAPLAELSALTRRPSWITLDPVHVKVVYDKTVPTAAKGYLYGSYS